MTEQEKQTLANDLTAYIGQPLNNPMTRSRWMEVARIALAALTSPPVKLPKKEKALIGRDYLYVYCAGPVESAIRAAGYEVQE